ncbi:MAG TPA: hypothetical protein PKJ68_06175, partial [Candidatus Woesebacteria bacterium]|nr:hypothetical protein [Candidatus Woesebacteria bacterium]
FARIVQQLQKQPDDLIYLPVLEQLIPDIKFDQYKYLRWLSDHHIIHINPMNMVIIDRIKLNTLH